jgi:hypothetical protein
MALPVVRQVIWVAVALVPLSHQVARITKFLQILRHQLEPEHVRVELFREENSKVFSLFFQFPMPFTL